MGEANELRSAVQLCREDEHVRGAMRAVHSALIERLETVQRLADLLANLGEKIESHFRDEEAGGLFAQLEAQTPELADQVTSFRSEHARFRARIRDLCDRATAQVDAGQAFKEEFEEFAEQLNSHEDREHDLRQEALDQDIDLSD